MSEPQGSAFVVSSLISWLPGWSWTSGTELAMSPRRGFLLGVSLDVRLRKRRLLPTCRHRRQTRPTSSECGVRENWARRCTARGCSRCRRHTRFGPFAVESTSRKNDKCDVDDAQAHGGRKGANSQPPGKVEKFLHEDKRDNKATWLLASGIRMGTKKKATDVAAGRCMCMDEAGAQGWRTKHRVGA
jgi:hypothetical protein